MITLTLRTRPIKLLLGVMASFAALNASAEVLDTLQEYGNAATADATSGAGIDRGFTDPAADEYTITAGGTDLWGNSDNGSFIYDSTQSRAADEDFSAIVRSVSIAADPAEALAGEWGRTGIMARKDPLAANSANVAHTRKTGTSGNAGSTLNQARPNDGGGTDRNPGGVTDAGYHGNAAASNANGSVRNTPIWLGLHRVDGNWYTTWADDAGGTPGTWSAAIARPGSADTQGEVWVGLAHQSHGAIHPQVNTAVFDNFEVGAFDPALGSFPGSTVAEVTFSGEDVFLTANIEELGVQQDVDWEVRSVRGPVLTTGKLQVDLYNVGNNGTNQSMSVLPDAGTFIVDAVTTHIDAENYYWSENDSVNYPPEFTELGLLGRGWGTGNEENYGAKTSGQIFIPSDADRDGVEEVRFHDLIDDYCYLEIDGVPDLINDNTWTDHLGEANGGGAQVTFDVSDAKYDDGEWVDFCLVMWEGGGGDHNGLTWDALDRTGVDTNTGGVDSALNTYNTDNLPDGTQVNFPFDASDLIPPENFRAMAPVIDIESGTGQPDELQLANTLDTTTTELQLFINGELVSIVPTQPTIIEARFTGYEEATIQIADVVGARVVDELTLAVTRDGNPITPTITKTGDVTMIVDDFGGPPEPYTDYTYEITGTTTVATGAVPFSFTVVPRSFPILEELRAGLATPPNATEGWQVMEFDVPSAIGGNLGGGAQMFRDAQYVLRDAGAPTAEAIEPYLNHTDPDTNTNTGDFRTDLPILGDDPGDDDQYVTLARTIVSIPAGQGGNYTFRIQSDDGYGIRVEGGTFTSTAGDGQNTIHPDEPSSAFFPNGTGNSNAFLVCDIPEGDHLIEFFTFEGGGGSYFEVAWAPGSFTDTTQTSAWVLPGDFSGYVPSQTSPYGEIPASVIPELPMAPDVGWSTHFWYNAAVGTIAASMNTLRDIDAGTATFDSEATSLEPFLDHTDTGGTGQFGNNLPFPGDPDGQGTDTNNILMIAQARIMAPADGDYTLQMRSDDGFMFRWVDRSTEFHTINGNSVTHADNMFEVYHPGGTGDSNTRASAFLTAGTHDLIVVWWEGGGGAHFEVSAAPGVVAAHAEPPFEVLSASPTDPNNLSLVGVTVGGEQPSIVDVQFDAGTSELMIFTSEVPVGETFHLRMSPTFGSPSGNDAADWTTIPFDFDSTTAQPFVLPVDTGANPTMGFKTFTGPSTP